MTAAPSIEGGLSQILSRELGEPVRVDDLHPLRGGSSRSLWAFDATWSGAARPLVLCRNEPGAAAALALRSEGEAMRAAGAAGVPVPKVYAVCASDEPLGGPSLVMERVEGEALPRRILSSPDLEGARAMLAGQCGQALGQVHSIPRTSVPGVHHSDRLAEYRSALDELDRGRPALELGYQYLADGRPTGFDPVLVHGDYRLGNLMVDRRGLRAVLDWESSHWGDPLEDLGWIAIKAWRFRGPGVVGGFGTTEDFLAGYEAATGVDVPPDAFQWALVLNTWVWGVGCLRQAGRHLSGTRRTPDLAVVGRRVAEIERDLLELLP